MKLLFDQNLSPSLVESLADIYPESVHVQSVGLDRADDTAVWQPYGNYCALRELSSRSQRGISSIKIVPQPICSG